MRRVVVRLLVIAMVVVLSVPAAALDLPNSWVDGGNTYFGTFRVKGQTDWAVDTTATVVEYWQQLMTGEHLLVYEGTDGKVYFVGGSGFKFGVSLQDNKLMLSLTGKGLVFVPSGDGYDYLSIFSASASTPMEIKHLIATRGVTFSPGGIGNDRLYATKTGDLIIVDDLGDAPDDEGILGWLKSFWDKFVSLWVPREGYFDDWFRQLREAFSRKVGGIDKTMSDIQSDFSDLGDGNNTLVIGIKDNALYKGSAGVEVDLADYMQPILKVVRPLLTALIVLVTAILCYKRIIALINT